MTARDLLWALTQCGFPGQRTRPRLSRLIKAGVIGRRKIEPSEAVIGVLVAMSSRPASEAEGAAVAMMHETNRVQFVRAELLMRGLYDLHANVYVVNDWRTIELLHVDLVEPVSRGAVQICKLRGALLAEHIGKAGGWWGASPSPTDSTRVLPDPPPDRRPKDRRS